MNKAFDTIDLVERPKPFSVKYNIVVLCIQTYCVYPLARWTQILSTRLTVEFSVPMTLGALLHMYLSTNAYGCHVVESTQPDLK